MRHISSYVFPRKKQTNTNPFEGRKKLPIAIISFDIDFASIFQLLALTDITGYANSEV